MGFWGALKWPYGQPQHLTDGTDWGAWQHPNPTAPEDRTGFREWVGRQGPQDGTLLTGIWVPVLLYPWKPGEANPGWKRGRRVAVCMSGSFWVQGYGDFCPCSSRSASIGWPETALLLAVVRWTCSCLESHLEVYSEPTQVPTCFGRRRLVMQMSRYPGLGLRNPQKNPLFLWLCILTSFLETPQRGEHCFDDLDKDSGTNAHLNR